MDRRELEVGLFGSFCERVRGSGEGWARGFFPCPDESQLLFVFFSETIWRDYFVPSTRNNARRALEMAVRPS